MTTPTPDIGTGDRDDRGVVVRDANRGDLRALADLLTQLHPRYGAKADETTLSQILDNPNRALLIAEHGSKIIGAADLLVVPNLSHGGRPWAIVENVVVDESHRGGGIGKLLMDEALKRADAAGVYMVQLLSLKHRVEAHAFYRRLGYDSACEGFRLYREGFAATTADD